MASGDTGTSGAPIEALCALEDHLKQMHAYLEPNMDITIPTRETIAIDLGIGRGCPIGSNTCGRESTEELQVSTLGDLARWVHRLAEYVGDIRRALR
jgi:hypothetical protein